MKTIGKRKPRPLLLHPDSEALKIAAGFNDQIHKLPTGNTTFFPKGIYRYRNHEEANAHWEECLIRGMAAHARK